MPTQTAAPQYRRTKVAVVVVLAFLVVLGGGVVASALYLQGKLNSGVERFADPFAELEGRPASHAGSDAPVNFLVLGSDTRISAGEASQWEQSAQQTDAIMIAQLSADRRSAAVLSIPRGSWVTIPGHGEGRISAAFALGGPALTVQTVEELTGIPIDHLVIADFESFTEVTDIVGDVPLELPVPTVIHGQDLPRGRHLLDGDTALAYLQQHVGLPEDELARVVRHQTWLRGVMHAVNREGVLTTPGALAPFLETVGETLIVDENLSISRMRDLAFSARNLSAADVVFMAAPVEGAHPGPDGSEPIIQLDDAALASVSDALAAGTVHEYLAENPHALRALNVSDN